MTSLAQDGKLPAFAFVQRRFWQLGKPPPSSCLSRWSVEARSIITVPDTLWMEQRWEHLSEWPAIWSPGEQPSLSPTCTTETAWLMRTGRSTPLCVIFFCPYAVILLIRWQLEVCNLPHLFFLSLSLFPLRIFVGCANGAVSLPEIRKASCSLYSSDICRVQRQKTTCEMMEDLQRRACDN